VDVTNSDGETPLHIAALEGRFEAVVELVRAGANTLLQDVDGRTVLHIAVCKEHVDLLHLLLDSHHGQTLIRLTDSAGKTPLHQAVLQGCDQIVQIFLAKGADPRMPIGKSSGDGKLDAERANFLNGIITPTGIVSTNQQPDNLNTVK
jgi:ankyrin repeat protein